MKHIGIVWVTVPWALLCIEEIVHYSYSKFGKDSLKHPKFTYIQPALCESELYYEKKDREWLSKYIADQVNELAKSNIDFVIIPSNSPHFAIEQIKKQSLLPILSIIDVVKDEIKNSTYNTIWVLGVKATMYDWLYSIWLQKEWYKVITLPEYEQDSLNNLIYDEIIYQKPTMWTFDKVLWYVTLLKDLWCEVFIAWCTEIPMVLDDRCPLPYIDSTRLLARSAVDYAIQN